MNLEKRHPSKEEIKSDRVCPALGNVLMVDSEGNITVCCVDEVLENKVGNLKEMDLKQALESEKLRKWIEAQERQDYKNMAPKCRNCSFYREYLNKNS